MGPSSRFRRGRRRRHPPPSSSSSPTSPSSLPVPLLVLVRTFAFVIAFATARMTTIHPRPFFVSSMALVAPSAHFRLSLFRSYEAGSRSRRRPRRTDARTSGFGMSSRGGCCRGPAPVFSSHGDGGEGSSSSRTSVVDRLDLHGKFERWVLLRDLLDGGDDGGGIHADDVNEVLYLTLSSVNKMHEKGMGRKVEKEWKENHGESPPPTLDGDDFRTIRHLLDKHAVVVRGGTDDGARRIPALVGPNCASSAGDDPSVLSDLETLLPDPDENEDAHKGAWDTVMELHGRESVRMEEEGSGDGKENWDARCLVARVLIYFNFLADGIVGGDGDV